MPERRPLFQGTGRSKKASISCPGLPEIRQALSRRPGFLDVSVGRSLRDLDRFLTTVRLHGFTEATRRFFEDDSVPMEPLASVENAGRRFAALLGSGRSVELFRKALEEAFLDASGIDYDLSLLDVDWGMKKFLIRHDIPGFIALFLELYVFHSIWLCLQDEMRVQVPNERAFSDLMSKIRTMSQDAVGAILDEAAADGRLEQMAQQPDAGVSLLSRIESRLLNAPAGS